jgi:hypothetical protein
MTLGKIIRRDLMLPDRIDFERLLKLRLVVARYGEMDVARWWNTQSQLGKYGASSLQRGFPRTHHFAQARSVFAVAANRCAQLFVPPRCVTLWQLPESIEDEFEVHWEHWLDHAADWKPFFEQLTTIDANDLVAALRDLASVSPAETNRYSKLRRSAEGRAVPLPDVFSGTNEDTALLALGFARGELGAPAVPYAQRGDA